MDRLMVAMAAPALWAAVSHIDKYLLSRHFRNGTGALTIIAALAGVPMAVTIPLVHPHVLHLQVALALLLVGNGMLYVGALPLYFSALARADAAVVAAVLQSISVFSYLLGWLVLGEKLTLRQLVASALIVGGGAALAVEFDRRWRAIRFQWAPFCLALLASLLVALNGLIFKFVAIRSGGQTTSAAFWRTSFWEYVGFAAMATLLFITARPWRRQFVATIRASPRPVLGLNALNEAINLTGKVAMNYSTLLVPLALAWTAAGLQPAFTLLCGILLAMWRPRISTERLVKHALAPRITTITVMLAGTVLLHPFYQP